ncbi:MAG: helix-turn-helix domain-containing protein [Ruminococcaceae bacterium]|nr:helix-turn-helix domain-containing protein [Oscillospiraceae bacterium]
MTIYFGENLKKLRKSKDLTQEALADFLGMSFQAISKWERSETYPDITMLPIIASFFGVTVDSLLGTDMIEKEKQISEYCKKYSRLWNNGKIDEARDMLKNAIGEFPGNYDLLAKYLNALIHAQYDDGYLISIKPEVQRIYDNIQNYCTVDSIRIWTKKLMCRYLRDLSLIKNSGVDIADAEKILSEMPIMQNTRDYEAMYMYPHDDEKRAAACANGISEMLRLFGEIMNRKYKNFLDADGDISEAYINLVEKVMPDGDYGKSHYLMVINHQRLGVKKYLAGDEKSALEHFEKALKLAKSYDEMPEVLVHTSNAVKGLEFDKTRAYRFWEGSFFEDVKEGLINRPQLSEEFKSSEAFRRITENI